MEKKVRNNLIICIVGLTLGFIVAEKYVFHIVFPILIIIIAIGSLYILFTVQKTYKELLESELEIQLVRKERLSIYFNLDDSLESKNILKQYDESIHFLDFLIQCQCELLLDNEFFLNKEQREHVKELSNRHELYKN